MQKQAVQHRDQYLHDQADMYELLGQKNRAKILQNIRKVEELRREYGHIKFALKNNFRQTITQVTYPNNNTWEYTNTPQELETKINEQQNRHFHQSADTPIAQTTDTHPRLEKLLFANFQQSDIPDTSTKLKTFFATRNKENINTVISQEEFYQGIKKWKEKTSTSPSGRHLGHYHAQAAPDMDETQKGYTATFLWIHTSIINLALKRSIVLTRWKTVHTVASPKDTGITKIHRIRSLNLYEADLNLLLRVILSRRLLWKVEDNHMLADECWGSRKLRSAGDLGLQKVLTTELSALT